MPSDLELAIRWSKKIEAHLERAHRAAGRGLHEKLDSVERRLDEQTVRDLRFLATIRNKLVHEEGYDRIDDREEFRRRVSRAAKALGLRPAFPLKPLALAAAAVVALLLIAFAFFR